MVSFCFGWHMIPRKNFFPIGSTGSFGSGFFGAKWSSASFYTLARHSLGVIPYANLSSRGFSFFLRCIFFGLGGGGRRTHSSSPGVEAETIRVQIMNTTQPNWETTRGLKNDTWRDMDMTRGPIGIWHMSEPGNNMCQNLETTRVRTGGIGPNRK